MKLFNMIPAETVAKFVDQYNKDLESINEVIDLLKSSDMSEAAKRSIGFVFTSNPWRGFADIAKSGEVVPKHQQFLNETTWNAFIKELNFLPNSVFKKFSDMTYTIYFKTVNFNEENLKDFFEKYNQFYLDSLEYDNVLSDIVRLSGESDFDLCQKKIKLKSESFEHKAEILSKFINPYLRNLQANCRHNLNLDLTKTSDDYLKMIVDSKGSELEINRFIKIKSYANGNIDITTLFGF